MCGYVGNSPVRHEGLYGQGLLQMADAEEELTAAAEDKRECDGVRVCAAM